MIIFIIVREVKYSHTKMTNLITQYIEFSDEINFPGPNFMVTTF